MGSSARRHRSTDRFVSSRGRQCTAVADGGMEKRRRYLPGFRCGRPQVEEAICTADVSDANGGDAAETPRSRVLGYPPVQESFRIRQQPGPQPAIPDAAPFVHRYDRSRARRAPCRTLEPERGSQSADSGRGEARGRIAGGRSRSARLQQQGRGCLGAQQGCKVRILAETIPDGPRRSPIGHGSGPARRGRPGRRSPARGRARHFGNSRHRAKRRRRGAPRCRVAGRWSRARGAPRRPSRRGRCRPAAAPRGVRDRSCPTRPDAPRPNAARPATARTAR